MSFVIRTTPARRRRRNMLAAASVTLLGGCTATAITVRQLEDPAVTVVGHPPPLPAKPEPPPPPPPPAPKAIVANEWILLEEPISFVGKTADLDEQAAEVLDAVASLLQTNPDIVKAVVSAHTDSNGTRRDNERLSDSRAQVVVSELVDRGIDPRRLEPQGWGHSRPLVPEGTPDAGEHNRRIEIFIGSDRVDPPTGSGGDR